MSNSATRCVDKAVAKRLALQQQPDLYLEPKWLRYMLRVNMYIQVAANSVRHKLQAERPVRRATAWHVRASQRSAHSAPTFRLLLKVAARGAHKYHFWDLGSHFRTNKKLALLRVTAVELLQARWLGCGLARHR